MRVAALTGLAVEARLARRAGLAAGAGAGDPERSAALAEQLLAEGAQALVSFGLAGGLDPALPPGSLLLPRVIRDTGGGAYPVDPAWHAALARDLARTGLSSVDGDLFGGMKIVSKATDKAIFFRETGASAVDLESHIGARVAAAAGRPFLALRAIADPADLDLPTIALLPLDPQGRPVLRRILFALAGEPGQLSAALALALATRRALHALGKAAPLLASSAAAAFGAQ